MGVGLVRGRIMWHVSFLAVILVIWMERNKCCCEGTQQREEALINNVKLLVASWVCIYPAF